MIQRWNYAAGPLDGQGGSGESNLLGAWTSTGDATTPGDPFVVRSNNLPFGPQETLFDNPALGSIGRSPQVGIGGATRFIGNGTNTNIQSNITNNFRESFTQLKMVWNGGKVGFALSDREFDLSTLAIKLLPDPGLAINYSGFGFSIEADAIDPDIGILKSTVFRAFTNGSAGNTVDSGAGIQLVKGETYQVFVQSEVSNIANAFGTEEDQISVYVLSEADVANPESTVYLADLPATQQSVVAQTFGHFAMRDNLQFSTYATQNFEADDVQIGFLNGTDINNFNDDVARDPARQALVAFRTLNQKIAWKSALGDPYLPGDTRLDGVVLGSPTTTDVRDDDINHLASQVRLGNTSTVSYYDLDSSGVIDNDDIKYLVETIFGSSLGDFDLDKDVDGDDLAAWQANYGNAGGWSEGDANSNGIIDGGDFMIWQRNHTGPSVVAAPVSAVPEPSSVVLAMVVSLTSIGFARARRLR